MKTELFTYEQVKAAMTAKEYNFYDGEGNVNLIGVRTKNKIADNFDDYLIVAMEFQGKPTVFTYKDFTTDPGIYYLKTKLLNERGCAILKPGQYPSVWMIGKHFSYEALIQIGGPISVYRDSDRDNELDFDESKVETGFFGINFHHGYDSKNVNNNSAGCQVFKLIKDQREVLSLCKQQPKKYGNKFTYTLLLEEDLMINKIIDLENSNHIDHGQTEKETIQRDSSGHIPEGESTETT